MRNQVDLRKYHYKASGDDGIPAELFKILKDDAVKVLSLGWEDPLEKGKATHSSILAWRIPWTV